LAVPTKKTFQSKKTFWGRRGEGDQKSMLVQTKGNHIKNGGKQKKEKGEGGITEKRGGGDHIKGFWESGVRSAKERANAQDNKIFKCTDGKPRL